MEGRMANKEPQTASTLEEKKKAEVDAEIKQSRQIIRDAEKRIKELKADSTIVQDVTTWQEIQKLKEKTLKELQNIDGCKSWNLTKMMKVPTFFTYQNPDNAMQKAADDTVDWVVKYRKKNNSVAALIETAQKSHLKMVRKIFGRIKKRNRKADDETEIIVEVSDPLISGIV